MLNFILAFDTAMSACSVAVLRRRQGAGAPFRDHGRGPGRGAGAHDRRNHGGGGHCDGPGRSDCHHRGPRRLSPACASDWPPPTASPWRAAFRSWASPPWKRSRPVMPWTTRCWSSWRPSGRTIMSSFSAPPGSVGGGTSGAGGRGNPRSAAPRRNGRGRRRGGPADRRGGRRRWAPRRLPGPDIADACRWHAWPPGAARMARIPPTPRPAPLYLRPPDVRLPGR